MPGTTVTLVVIIKLSIQNFTMPKKLFNKLIVFYAIYYRLTIKISAQFVNESFMINYAKYLS